jgi:putative SOS response-associated peptidase YedK
MSNTQRVSFLLQFNARSETLAEKFVFSNLLQRRRCVFPCNGWYEWLKEVRHQAIRWFDQRAIGILLLDCAQSPVLALDYDLSS